MPKNTFSSSDQIRLLTLLWDTPGRVGRPGRSGIDVGSITRTAIDLADAGGLAAVTMRGVAERMGVGAMSLYSHVPGKAELVELMLDRVAGEVYSDDDLPAGRKSWQEGLRHVAERNWGHHLAHPWSLEVNPGRPGLGPGVAGKYEAELAPLDGVGLGDAEIDHALSATLGLVESCARWQIGLDRVRQGADDHAWWDAVAPALTRAMGGRSYPLAERVGTAAGEEHAAGDPRATMYFALGLIIEGLERRLPPGRRGQA